MAQLIFKNNAQTTITGAISPTATSVQLQAGTGVLFATPAAGQYFVATFVDAATGLRNEIVWVTQMVGDTATIVRGQEGTAAQSWAPNDAFSELWTAGQAGSMLQRGDEQAGTSTFGVDTGVANAYTIVLTPPIIANTLGQTFRFKALNSNTGASTVNFGTGAVSLRNSQGLVLSGGEIIAGYVYECYWNGATYNLALPSLVSIPVGLISPYGGGSVPTGWLACIGQLLLPATYPALFGVLGTVYGGNGTTTFGIPDLRGRVAAGLDGGQNRVTNTGTGNSGIAGNTLGAVGGEQTHLLGLTELPPHSHAVPAIMQPGGSLTTGVGAVSTSLINDGTSGAAGSGLFHQNMQPTIMLSYMIKT